MRSTWSSGIASSVGAPTVDDDTRSPSTRSTVWPRFAPRRNTPEVAPGPPFWTISTPGWPCRSSAKLRAPEAAIASASITVRSAVSVAIGCGMRAAVTTTGASCAIGGAGSACAAASDGPSSAAGASAQRGHRRWAGGRSTPGIACPRAAARPRTAVTNRRTREHDAGDSARATPRRRPPRRRLPASPLVPVGTAPQGARIRVQAGLRARRADPPAFPSRSARQWRRGGPSKGLPLRGQPRNPGLDRPVTAFPFHPPR